MRKHHAIRGRKGSGLALAMLAVLLVAGGVDARASAIGRSKKFGLGLMVGQPSGPTLKYFFTPKHALTVALGVGWWGGHNLHVHVDYGYHFMLKRDPAFDLPIYVGGGLKFFYYYHGDYHPYWEDDWRYRDYSRAGLGLRIPIGIAIHFNRYPIDLFFELAPGFAFLPWFDGFLDGGIGFRYYF